MYVTSPVSIYRGAMSFPGPEDGKLSNCASHIYRVEAGKSVFREGDSADYIYEILEGVVRSSKVLCDGRRQVMSFGYPGDILGLSHDCHYHSDCDAVSDLRLRVFKRNACSVNTAKDPAFSDQLLKIAAAEVSSMQEHFLMLGRKSAVEKIASFLVALLNRQGEKVEGHICFDLPMKRSDIADFLGLTIETVSRTLTKLRKDGVIELPTAHKVCVVKPQLLCELAERDGDA